jgi:hypothetical protein
MDLISIVEKALERAERGESKLPLDFPLDDSLSGAKGRALINNICSNECIKYLEVGSYAGSTFASALCGNAIEAVAIDIWEQFIEQPRASRVKGKFFERMNRFKSDCAPRVIEKSIYDLQTAEEVGPGINFYFYDADHTAQATEMGIICADRTFEKEFILMVDDYAMISTRKGVDDAVEAMGYEKLYWKELGSLAPYDWYTPEGKARTAGEPDWWCNYLIAVLRKKL